MSTVYRVGLSSGSGTQVQSRVRTLKRRTLNEPVCRPSRQNLGAPSVTQLRGTPVGTRRTIEEPF